MLNKQEIALLTKFNCQRARGNEVLQNIQRFVTAQWARYMVSDSQGEGKIPWQDHWSLLVLSASYLSVVWVTACATVPPQLCMNGYEKLAGLL